MADKKEISNKQFSTELISELFPHFGKAFIDALCQYYNLSNAKTNVEAELQRVVTIIFNNQLPRELLNMNQSAQTLRELYVVFLLILTLSIDFWK